MTDQPRSQLNNPQLQPVLRRRLVLNDLENNHNKFWEVVLFPNGEMHTTWGRVGITPPAPKIERGDLYKANKKASEKLGKGYQEVDLHKIALADGKTTAITILDPRLESFVSMVYKEAGKKRESFLSVSLEQISPAQIQKAKVKLMEIDSLSKGVLQMNYTLPQLVQAYYNLIPTKLPARMDKDKVVTDFVANLSEQEQRLNQLEAGLKSYQFQQANHSGELAALGGVIIKPLEQSESAYGQIHDYVSSTAQDVASWRIRDIFTVRIPSERSAYDAETFGKHYVTQLFHGTYNHNLQYILSEGLKVPQTAANGRRFGSGIYFADKAARSLGYVGGSQSGLRTMFISDVALGTPKKMDGTDHTLREAPRGHHSVWGIKAFSGMDEFIVYRPSQTTVRAIVIFE